MQRFFGHHTLGQGQIYISLVQYGLTSVNLGVLYLHEKNENMLER